MTLLAPESIFAGAFRVVARIGAGGMGEVYEVEQLSTRKRRALKVISNRLGGDEKAQARFVREATVGADIHSEHCVDVIGAGFDQATGLPWLVMELLNGVDLRRLVDQSGPLGPAHALEVFRQIGHGLGAAHDAGVVHRDLKPENIFVARSMRAGPKFIVKILDFGIAKITREAVGNSDTATVGSPMWMAPEQINADQLSPRSDVWALGLLAFWALTGRIYWSAAYGDRVTVQALFAEQLFAELVPASVRAAVYRCGVTLPPQFDAWFANCVNRTAQERFADARAAANALRTILEPGAAIDVRASAPLLPAPGEPADARTEQPVLGLGDGVPVAYEMAGTTGDMLMDHSGPESLVATAASGPIGVESTDVHGGAPSQEQATQYSPAARNERVRTKGPSGATLAAAIAVPVLLLGAAGAALYAYGTDETVPPPRQETRADQTPESDPVAGSGPSEPKSTAGTKEEGDTAAGGSGVVDLSSLPTPKRLEFLGWTGDGRYFATKAAYGEKVPRSGDANYLEMVHVHDQEGAVRESYVLERVSAPDVAASDALGAATADAFTARQWVHRRIDLLLTSPEPRRQPSKRNGTVQLAVDSAPWKTRLRIQPKRSGFDFRWWGFADVEDPETLSPARWRIEWDEDGERVPLVTDAVELSYTALAEVMERDNGVVVAGAVQIHWSEDEDRCVVLIDIEARGEDGEVVAERRLFTRAVPRSGGG